ncbi:PadR family transcriptional regulator [Natronomonas sp. EA1]|uniref:PadR family transcriptional regulator n=1 Tax=Natronomonas sp. EA1 TaxID=3421655 RepID=UPI003EBC78A7
MGPNAKDVKVGGANDDGGISVRRLYREIAETEASGVRLAPEQHAESVVDSVVATLFDEPFMFDESMVKGDLDEILMLLVALRDGETHGKGLMEDLATIFGARLSPGTVYPRLHELEADGTLEMQELVRTKEYRVDDVEALIDRTEHAMRQHLALGFFFYTALREF